VAGIDPLYFLDEMSQDELTAIMAAKNETDLNLNRKSWEQTRLMCFYAIAATQGTKDFKSPEDLFKLPWDEKDEKPKAERLTKEEFLKKAEEIKNLKKLG
jgi:hypothetical protein